MRRGAVFVVCVALLGACGTSTSKHAQALDTTALPVSIVVRSPAFANGRPIPRANTCDGAGGPPTIAWRAVPPAAKAVAVVVDDPDATNGTFVHWIVVGLAPGPGQVPSTAANAHELDNTGGTHGWTPPCPPPGPPHHYRFTVYALRDYVCAANGDEPGAADCSPPAAADALSQIRSAAIAKGVLVGTYTR